MEPEQRPSALASNPWASQMKRSASPFRGPVIKPHVDSQVGSKVKPLKLTTPPAESVGPGVLSPRGQSPQPQGGKAVQSPGAVNRGTNTNELDAVFAGRKLKSVQKQVNNNNDAQRETPSLSSTSSSSLSSNNAPKKPMVRSLFGQLQRTELPESDLTDSSPSASPGSLKPATVVPRAKSPLFPKPVENKAGWTNPPSTDALSKPKVALPRGPSPKPVRSPAVISGASSGNAQAGAVSRNAATPGKGQFQASVPVSSTQPQDHRPDFTRVSKLNNKSNVTSSRTTCSVTDNGAAAATLPPPGGQNVSLSGAGPSLATGAVSTSPAHPTATERISGGSVSTTSSSPTDKPSIAGDPIVFTNEPRPQVAASQNGVLSDKNNNCDSSVPLNTSDINGHESPLAPSPGDSQGMPLTVMASSLPTRSDGSAGHNSFTPSNYGLSEHNNSPMPSARGPEGRSSTMPSARGPEGRSSPMPSARGPEGRSSTMPSARGPEGRSSPMPSTWGPEGRSSPMPSARGPEGRSSPMPSVRGPEGRSSPMPSAWGPEGRSSPMPSARGPEGCSSPMPSARGPEGRSSTMPSARGPEGCSSPMPSARGPEGRSSTMPSARGPEGRSSPMPSAWGPEGRSSPMPSAWGPEGRSSTMPSARGPEGRSSPMPSAWGPEGRSSPMPSAWGPEGRSSPMPSARGPEGRSSPMPSARGPEGRSSPMSSTRSPEEQNSPMLSTRGPGGRNSPMPSKRLPERGRSPMPSNDGFHGATSSIQGNGPEPGRKQTPLNLGTANAMKAPMSRTENGSTEKTVALDPLKLKRVVPPVPWIVTSEAEENDGFADSRPKSGGYLPLVVNEDGQTEAGVAGPGSPAASPPYTRLCPEMEAQLSPTGIAPHLPIVERHSTGVRGSSVDQLSPGDAQVCRSHSNPEWFSQVDDTVDQIHLVPLPTRAPNACISDSSDEEEDEEDDPTDRLDSQGYDIIQPCMQDRNELPQIACLEPTPEQLHNAATAAKTASLAPRLMRQDCVDCSPDLPEKRRSRGQSVDLTAAVPPPRPPPPVVPRHQSPHSSGNNTPSSMSPRLPRPQGHDRKFSTLPNKPCPPIPAGQWQSGTNNRFCNIEKEMCGIDASNQPVVNDDGRPNSAPSCSMEDEMSDEDTIVDAPPLPPRTSQVPKTPTHRTQRQSSIDPDTVVPAPLIKASRSSLSKLQRKSTEDEGPASGPFGQAVPTPCRPGPNIEAAKLGYLPMSSFDKRRSSEGSLKSPTLEDRHSGTSTTTICARGSPKSTPEPFSNLWDSNRDVRSHSYLDLVDANGVPVEMTPEAWEAMAATNAEHDEEYFSMFDDEPLYQIYHADIVAREIVQQNNTEEDEINPEDEDDYLYMDADSVKNQVSDILARNQSLDEPDRECSVEMYSSLLTEVSSSIGARKLWSDMPAVKKSGILEDIKPEERKLQESLFEIVTSEASYQKSLQLLVCHFVKAPQFSCDNIKFGIISRQDHHVLFSNIIKVRAVSQRFLRRLEAFWRDNCRLDPLVMCELVADFVSENFDVYIKYVSNQMYQERKLKQLRESSQEFVRVLAQLEEDRKTQGLTMQSFLALPMQRVTRLPLLVDSVCHRMDARNANYPIVTNCLNVLQKVVRQCNEGARRMSNLEQIAEIDRMLVFKNMKRIPLVTQARSLVKKGRLVKITPQTGFKLKRKKDSLHFFLFNDLLIITKKKGEDQYSVVEHSSRINVHAELLENEDIPRVLPGGAPSSCKNFFILILMDKEMQYVLSCESMSERMRWVEAVTPAQQVNDDETIYEAWDCPQVQAVHKYVAQEPDELSLEESDIVNVFRKMSDGWYEGERIRDSERGWFPSNFTMEIQSQHQRAKNLRQRYRLMLNTNIHLQNSGNTAHR